MCKLGQFFMICLVCFFLIECTGCKLTPKNENKIQTAEDFVGASRPQF